MAVSIKFNNREIFLRILVISRSISTTYVSLDAHNTSKMMQKFLQKKQRKKSHHWTNVRQPVIPQLREKGKGKGYSEGLDKRMSHINRLFYETASQIVANGELDVYFDITKVKVVPDFSNVLIYWEAKGTEEDVETEKLLERKAGYLRSLMMKSNVVGRVPPLTFVKDKTYSRMMEIERLLRIAESQAMKEEALEDVVEFIEEHGEISDIAGDRVETITNSRDSHESDDELIDSADINARLGQGFSSDTHGVKSKYKSEKVGIKKQFHEEKQIDNSDMLASKMNLRHDLYGIKHDALIQKITNMKSSSRHRVQQPEDLANLKTSDSLTGNVRNFDKQMTKKQRAENLKKYTEFFHQKTRKGSLREEIEAVMTMNVAKTDIDQEYEYGDENDAEYELSGIEKYFIDKRHFGDGTDHGYYSDVESDDKEGTENVMELDNDSGSNTDKQP